MRIKTIYLFIGFYLLVSALQAGGKTDTGRTPVIVTSTSIIADVVENISGDHFHVISLIGQGQDPHSYEPTPRDIAKVEDAAVLFVNGFNLEENLLRLLHSASESRIVEVSSRISPLESTDKDENNSSSIDDHAREKDPHTWMSPLNVISWTKVIEEVLSELDPANTGEYQHNSRIYSQKLAEAHNQFSGIFDKIPGNRRILLTDHNVFGYLARDYDLIIIGSLIPGFSTNAEISSASLAKLVETVRDNKIRSIFLGTTSGKSVTKLSDALKQEAGFPMQVLPVLTGALASEGDKGDTYLGYIQYNIEQIRKGFGSE